MCPSFSTMYNCPVPSDCKSRGRSKPDATCCHEKALGSGNVVTPGSVGGEAVGGICVGAAVVGIVVGGADVSVIGLNVGEGGGVSDPLHASNGNINRRINRLIRDHLLSISVASASTTSSP